MQESSQQPNDVTAPRPRPNAAWQCGFTAMGGACPNGPSGSGTCCFAAEKSAENSASMTPPEGSECERLFEEFGPCIPQRAPWFTRQTIAINAALLVGGILLLCMLLPQREKVFVPGNLSAKHAQILGNTLISERCSLCHPNSHAEVAAGTIQDDLCMNCHETHMPDAKMGMSHDLQPWQISKIRESMSGPAKLVGFQKPSKERETYCADCHVEHHGGNHDLKAITDRRCQACHAEQFESFSQGHPQFKEYPYRSERRIAFDHATHESKYFGQKNETFECSRCHLDRSKASQIGNVFRSVGFDEACGSCHKEPIRSSAVNGWVMLQMPCIAPEDKDAPELGLSDWPSSAVFDYDGEVSIAMRSLLANDSEATVGLSLLAADGKIASTPKKDRPEVARSLARGFRKFINDVAQNGQAAWQSRLTKTLQVAVKRELNKHETQLIAELSAGLPPDLFRQIEIEWFGKTRSVASAPDRSTRMRLVASPGDDLLTDSSAALLGDSSDDELLAGGINGNDSAADDAILGNGLDDELLGGGDSDDELLSSGLGEPSQETHQPENGGKLVAAEALQKVSGSEHVSQGGWFLDKDIMAVRYVPRGHADPILSAWAEYVAILERSATGEETQPWQHPETPLGKLVPGGCTECHLIGESDSSQSVWQNWKSTARPFSARLFTKFDHTPHLALAVLKDCRYCHLLKTENATGSPLVSMNELIKNEVSDDVKGPSRFVSMTKALQSHLHGEFLSMSRSQCVTCHHSGSANEGCTQCHNYHVGSEGFEWSHQK